MPDGAGAPTGTPLSDPPLVEMISEDPVLRNTKLIAEAWDCDGLNQARPSPYPPLINPVTHSKHAVRWSSVIDHVRVRARFQAF